MSLIYSVSSAVPPEKFRFFIPTANKVDVTIGNLWLSEKTTMLGTSNRFPVF